MKKEIANVWSKALRSGKYKQGRAALASQREDGSWSYCCLGVLCEVGKRKGVDLEILKRERGYSVRKFYSGHDTDLPPEIKNWSGMESREGRYKNKHGSIRSLTIFNDGNNKGVVSRSFEEIADIIDEHWRLL